MAFNWKITRPPMQAAIHGVAVMHPGIEVDFETDTIDIAFDIFNNKETELAKMFGAELMHNASKLAMNIGTGEERTGDGETGEQTIVETERQRKAREKREKKNNNDPASANAPDPVVIPGADAPPTAPATADDGIPEALRRAAPAAAALAPPPPAIAPPAPPAPPPAPPSGVLAGKIIADLDRRATGAVDGGQALADWIATSGITVKGATYAEAIEVLRLQADEKLGSIAAHLGVA